MSALTEAALANPCAVPEQPTFMVAQVAEVLGIGRNAAYQLVREGRIRSLRVGSRILVPRTALLAFLAE